MLLVLFSFLQLFCEFEIISKEKVQKIDLVSYVTSGLGIVGPSASRNSLGEPLPARRPSSSASAHVPNWYECLCHLRLVPGGA